MKRILSPYESTQLARYGARNMSSDDTTPIEYVTGIAEFCGLQFSVDPSVLIPRVETEGLVEIALECLSEKLMTANQLSIVDVGTGSGAIIISLAKHLEQSSVTIDYSATDISQEALTVAKKNAEKLTTSPIALFHDDLLENTSKRFDVITANLPYIPSGAVKKLDDSVINHEPIIALDGGNDGFDLIKKLIQTAPTKLKVGGSLILELDTSHTKKFFTEFETTFVVTFFNDCFDRHRFARLDLKN